MTWTPGQLSFDSPAPVAVPETPSADPVAMAIALHEQAKARVQELKEPHKSAEIEFIRTKRIRDEAKAVLEKAQLEFDQAARDKHVTHKAFIEACELSRQIGVQVREMGGMPAGDNTYWTPAKYALFISGEWRNMSDEEWQAMA